MDPEERTGAEIVRAIVESPLIDDRRLGELSSRDDPDAVRNRQRVLVRERPARRRHSVRRQAADLLVQRDELLGRDDAVGERLQSVLDSGVVGRRPSAVHGARRRAPDRNRVVPAAAPRSVRVVERIVDLAWQELAVVAQCTDRRCRTGHGVEYDVRDELPRLVVAAERVVPSPAGRLVHVTGDRRLPCVDLRLRHSCGERRERR